MKMTKEDRDRYVQDNYSSMTGIQLVQNTGWSLTTIKSVKRRLGLQKKTDKVLAIEEYLLEFYDKNGSIPNVAEISALATRFACKDDVIRDILKSLDLFKSVSTVAEENLINKYRDTLKIEGYLNTKTKVKVTCCTCGVQVLKRPNDLVTYTYICPCNSKQLIKDKELKDFIEKEQDSISNLRSLMYKRARDLREQYPLCTYVLETRCGVRCTKCYEIREINISTLKSKNPSKCPACSIRYNDNRGTERFLLSMKEQGNEIIEGEYTNERSVIKVLGVCGHTRVAGAGNLIRYDCPECRDKGDFYLYMFSDGNIVKIGVSKQVEIRVKRIALRSGLDLDIIFMKKGKRSDVYALERVLHNKFKDKRVYKFTEFEGATEFFYLDEEDIACVKNMSSILG